MAKEVKHDPRPMRVPFQFNLDRAKSDIKPIINEFERLRGRRKLTAFIVDMWRLWADLVDGKTNVLIELFPDFANRFTTTDGDKLLQSIFDQQAIILKKLEAGATMQPMQQTGKILSAPNFAVPSFDEDDDEPITLLVKADPNAAARITANFLDSAMGIH